MADLGTNALAQIETALHRAIRLGLQKRLPTVADVDALRAAASTGLADGVLRYVTSASLCYEWSTYSQATDDGAATVKPTDAGTAGRWLRTTSPVTTGYLRTVAYYAGEWSTDEIEARIFGQRPCVVIHYLDADNVPRSQVPGALYRYEPRFSLWCVAANMRTESQGKLGSSLAAEDIGAYQILGEVKALIAGSNLGQDGVDYVEIGHEDVIVASLGERKFAIALDVVVHATIHQPESDRIALDAQALNVQRELADLHGESEHDEDNYLASGLTVAVGSGLTQAVAAGTAYVGGTLATYAGASQTFGALTDTYRDLSAAGALTFVEVPHGASEPTVTASCLRVGVTVTDASDVVSDTLLVSTVEAFGAVDEVPKP